MLFYDKGYHIYKPNKRFKLKLKMAMKKPTKSDIEAGRVYRCGNCDALCTNKSYSVKTESYVMGRPQHEFTTYYCDQACAFKHCRDELRPKHEKKIEYLKESETFLKKVLKCYILDPDLKGKKSKTLFQAIKMIRQEIKSRTMLLSGESTLDIMKVEYFKLSEAAMELAELVAEEEDPQFNRLAKELPASMRSVTEINAQNAAMYARCMAEDKKGTLSLWFN
jgi:hypothetical protein